MSGNPGKERHENNESNKSKAPGALATIGVIFILILGFRIWQNSIADLPKDEVESEQPPPSLVDLQPIGELAPIQDALNESVIQQIRVATKSKHENKIATYSWSSCRPPV